MWRWTAYQSSPHGSRVHGCSTRLGVERKVLLLCPRIQPIAPGGMLSRSATSNEEGAPTGFFAASRLVRTHDPTAKSCVGKVGDSSMLPFNSRSDNTIHPARISRHNSRAAREKMCVLDSIPRARSQPASLSGIGNGAIAHLRPQLNSVQNRNPTANP